MKKNYNYKPGKPIPLGCYASNNGIQFALFSKNATLVHLHLFKSEENGIPEHTFTLSPEENKTGDVWHIWIEGLEHGQLYGYSIEGEYDPKNGHRFNANILLNDPYAKALTTNNSGWLNRYDFGYDASSNKKDMSLNPRKNFSSAVKSVICTKNSFDWENTKTLNTPLQDYIIYEAHVKGLTAHPSAQSKKPGTFLGVIEKIPYLKELGITALELLPIQEFNKHESTMVNPVRDERLVNYWGYSTINFFSPSGCYAFSKTSGKQVEEFKEMVKELHKANIEVILDVVFNHTAEGNELGPTLSFRGIDNTVYYMLEKDKRYYKNYSGCGNTFNCNHPVVRDFILDCLRYWVIEMHVDAFRFDLASILGRDQEGNIMKNPPLIERIAEDPILRSAKIIAEAWDAGGAYQVGAFPGTRWAEWNGRYRDDVKKFWKGEHGMVGTLATRITGSSDLYGDDGRSPLHSINFVTCHDGFTLRDHVSYERKHNLENGENCHDGSNDNCSFNCGVEGETKNKEILNLRMKMTKNFLATLFLSQGIPMMLGGDEFGRTQKGNNNAYCQDNEISWFDWSLLE
ncbi:MAG: glycogen debranching protein GlgX, partial [Nitrospinae bacterium]|nr:glycogen debranching protein GlgX [Nitrospinota bacterium]